jgi:L,D-peptidoglycan transpeptidase YkuD (ErfK/YbiS/YcfS/YnhG family)
MDIIVECRNGACRVRFDNRTFECAIGRGGLIDATGKHEGDGATPIGRWPLRRVLYRPDRGAAPETALPVAAITRHDGWCDDPDSRLYNTQVTLPCAARHETLWRDDALYDRIVVLGHNDDPPVPGAGSAIFLHCAKPGYPPTAGCVALAPADLDRILTAVGPGDALVIRAGRR